MNQTTQNSQTGGNTINPRSRLRKACFTLNNYTEDDFTQLLSTFHDMKYIIGKEVGESGTPHLQGYVEFGRQYSFKQVKELIGERAHIEKPKGTRKQNVKYCSKEGNFVSTFPLERKERHMKVYADVVWRDWQQKVIDVVKTKPDMRTVHWFWEPTGKVGKSFLSRYLFLKYEAIICSGKAVDVFHQVVKWQENHGEEDPILVIVDIPRSHIDYVSYLAIEKLKDGCLYSGKYEGGAITLDPVHVICFANEEPNKSALSHDRWHIERIHP